MGRILIARDDRSPSEVLMAALEKVEGARGVLILIDREDSLTCKTNLSHKDMKWLLDQAQYLTVADCFGMLDREDV